MHARKHAYMRACMRACVHACMHACMRARVRACTNARDIALVLFFVMGESVCHACGFHFFRGKGISQLCDICDIYFRREVYVTL